MVAAVVVVVVAVDVDSSVVGSKLVGRQGRQSVGKLCLPWHSLKFCWADVSIRVRRRFPSFRAQIIVVERRPAFFRVYFACKFIIWRPFRPDHFEMRIAD